MESFFNIKIAGIFILLICCLKSIECHIIPDRNLTENLKANTLINLLSIAQVVFQSAKEVATVEKSSGTEPSFHPMDCAEIQERNPTAKTGVYNIWPRSRIVKGPIAVYCDLSTGDDGGAWTVIQRRGDYGSSKDYFYRDWSEYKNGFGDVTKDFWIGNDNIFTLTNQRATTVKFVLVDWDQNLTTAEYEKFWIDDEYHKYTCHVTGYRGNAGDGFGSTNGMAFTTQDKDNDLYVENCAVKFKGAWWYTECHSSNLNGQYLRGAHESFADGVNWYPFRGQHYSLKVTSIKIRPRDFVRKFEMDATPQ